MSGGVGRFLLGAALVGAGFLIPGIGAFASGFFKTLLFTTGLGLASSAVSSLLVKKQGQLFEMTLDPNAPVPVIYGTARVGLRIADIRQDPSNKDRLYVVGVLCHGSRDGSGIHAIDEIYMDGRLAVNAAGTVQSPYTGVLTVTKYLGTDTQTADAALTSVFGTGDPVPWPATSDGVGLAYVVLRMDYDEKIWVGIPEVTVNVRGCRVHDPRDNTWKFSDNPALCLRDYLLSARYGAGADASEVDDDAFEVEANYCDETVSVPNPYPTAGTTTQKRFTCNGVVDTGNTVEENLRQLLTSCRGNLPYVGGVFSLFIRRPKTAATFALLEQQHLIGDFTYQLPGAAACPNVLEYGWVNPADNYRAKVERFPAPGASNAFLTADNGYLAEQAIELPFTTNAYMAQQIAQVTLREQRDGLVVTVTATEEALKLVPGDVVNVTHESPGWTAKPFWVMGMAFDPGSRTVSLSLVEYNAAAYTLDANTQFVPAPNTSLPDPTAVAAPTGLVLTSFHVEQVEAGQGTATIIAQWTASADPFVEYYEVEAKRDADADWVPYGRVRKEQFLGFAVTPVDSETLYDVRVIAVNFLGFRSTPLEDDITTAGPPVVAKTHRIHASAFSTDADLSWYQKLEDRTDVFGSGAADRTVRFWAHVPIPVGAQITTISVRLLVTQAGLESNVVTFRLKKINASGTVTTVASATTATYNTELTRTSSSFSETVAADQTYVAELEFSMRDEVGAVTDYFRWVELAYNSSSYAVRL